MRTDRIAPLLALLLAACAGSGEGLDRFGRPHVPGEDTAPDPFDYARQLLDSRCAKCHKGGGAPKGLDLSADVSYGNIVDVRSKEVPTMLLIAPGSPEDSYLWAKVSTISPARLGARMPRDGPPYLDDYDLEELRVWIAQATLEDSP